MKDNKDLQSFLDNNNIEAEIIEVGDTKTAEKASKRLGVDPSIVVKSIVFSKPSGTGVLTIVRGPDRVDFQKLKEVVGETCNTASPEEVLKFTDYKAGGVPPISSKIETYIDSKVMEIDICYAGAGTESHLIKIKSNDILKFSNGKIVDISKMPR